MGVITNLARWFRREAKPPAGCRACGICCELYGHTLKASGEDIERWTVEGRLDLLGRVGPEGMLWLDPATGERLEPCPFLVRRGADSAICEIHPTKPRICRDYPTPAHGNRCVRGVRGRICQLGDLAD